MITKITIENFKGIGDQVEIPICPITLLFGPNSAGKSTIMHAFHYAREVFERHNLNADKTIAGGDFIDLGGFKNFVHNHDLGNTISLRFDLDLKGVNLPTYWDGNLLLSGTQQIKTGWVEIEIGWDDLHQRPSVQNYKVGFNGQEIGNIISEKNMVVVSNFAMDKIMTQYIDEKSGDDEFIEPNDFLDDILSSVDGELSNQGYLCSLDQKDALPLCDRPLPAIINSDPESPESLQPTYSFIKIMSQVFVGMAEVVRNELQHFCYVGPLREKPSRGYVPPRFDDPSRWATGLGAWDALCSGEKVLIDFVNLWLSHEDLLNTGYTLSKRKYLQLDEENPLYGLLVNHQAYDEIEDMAVELNNLPVRDEITLTNGSGITLGIQDVGEGIGQVIPVIVAAFYPKASIVQIEQPELHLHPTQQAVLGDLLICGATGKTRKPFIIETHSEHLILRILRRIRETSKPGDIACPPAFGVTPDDLAVLYIQSRNSQVKIIKIDVDKDGEFIQPWPDDFFEQDYHERFA
jgi:hypothetical protein